MSADRCDRCGILLAAPNLFGSFAVRRRETFDSSATPRVGERRIEPRAMADVDLASLSERMAETIERARADDPKALRRRIKELEAAIADQSAPEPERVEIPILPVETAERIEAATTLVVASRWTSRPSASTRSGWAAAGLPRTTAPTRTCSMTCLVWTART